MDVAFVMFLTLLSRSHFCLFPVGFIISLISAEFPNAGEMCIIMPCFTLIMLCNAGLYVHLMTQQISLIE